MARSVDQHSESEGRRILCHAVAAVHTKGWERDWLQPSVYVDPRGGRRALAHYFDDGSGSSALMALAELGGADARLWHGDGVDWLWCGAGARTAKIVQGVAPDASLITTCFIQ